MSNALNKVKKSAIITLAVVLLMGTMSLPVAAWHVEDVLSSYDVIWSLWGVYDKSENFEYRSLTFMNGYDYVGESVTDTTTLLDRLSGGNSRKHHVLYYSTY